MLLKKLIRNIKDSKGYIKLFSAALILNMLKIRHYKKTLAMYSYIWDSLYL